MVVAVCATSTGGGDETTKTVTAERELPRLGFASQPLLLACGHAASGGPSGRGLLPLPPPLNSGFLGEGAERKIYKPTPKRRRE